MNSQATSAFKIFIADRFSVEALAYLKKQTQFQIISCSSSEQLTKKLHEELPTTHGLIIRSKLKVDSKLLDQSKKLKVIVTATSGFDHIDLNETAKRKITVMHTPEANTQSAAELTWALILACQRPIVAAHREIKAGAWSREPFIGYELANKNLGVVGFGRIGQKVAQIAKVFSMQVYAFDPYQEEDVFKKLEVQRVSYEEILKHSDILTFHVPATPETKNMLNRSHFEYIHPGCVIINTSRGSVLQEDDLAEALISKTIRCAGLDVFAKEPLDRNSKLLKCQNLIMTPHLGAYTEEAFQKASLQAAIQIEDFFLHNTISNALPLKNDWGSLSFDERA